MSSRGHRGQKCHFRYSAPQHKVPKTEGQPSPVTDTPPILMFNLTPDEIEKANNDGIELTQTEARQKIEYGVNRDGYWDSPKFMAQIDNVAKIASVKNPKETHTVVFVFDQSSGHTAHDDSSLNAKRLNLNPGGKQPKMRDTAVWQGQKQTLVFPDGKPKGHVKF